MSGLPIPLASARLTETRKRPRRLLVQFALVVLAVLAPVLVPSAALADFEPLEPPQPSNPQDHPELFNFTSTPTQTQTQTYSAQAKPEGAPMTGSVPSVNGAPAFSSHDIDAVRRAYRELQRLRTFPVGWTGNVEDCDPGTTWPQHTQAVLQTVNIVRAMSGVGPVVFKDGNSVIAQAAALNSLANGRLTHHPKDTSKCFSEDAYKGASSSNLSLGRRNGPIAVLDGYMVDPGSNNKPVGHRRWITSPMVGNMGTGDTPRSNALFVFGTESIENRPDHWSAWPTEGYFPSQMVPKRWSLTAYSGKDHKGRSYENAQVKVTGPNGQVPLQIVSRGESFSGGALGNQIVWEMDIDPVGGSEEVQYHVEVTGILEQKRSLWGESEAPKTVSKSYTVTVIDGSYVVPSGELIKADNLCSGDSLEWTSGKGKWWVTLGTKDNPRAYMDSYAGASNSIKVKGISDATQYVATLWRQSVDGYGYYVSDTEQFSCGTPAVPVGKFSSERNMCSGDELTWAKGDGYWWLTVGNNTDPRAYMDSYVGGSSAGSALLKGVPASGEFVATLWRQQDGGAYKVSDTQTFECGSETTKQGCANCPKAQGSLFRYNKLCSGDELWWHSAPGKWWVTAGSEHDDRAYVNSYAGAGSHIILPDVPASGSYVIKLWHQKPEGGDYQLTDTMTTSCTYVGDPNTSSVGKIIAPKDGKLCSGDQIKWNPDRGYWWLTVGNTDDPSAYMNSYIGGWKQFQTKVEGIPNNAEVLVKLWHQNEEGGQYSVTDTKLFSCGDVKEKPGVIKVPTSGSELCPGDSITWTPGDGYWWVTVGSAYDKRLYMDSYAGGSAASSITADIASSAQNPIAYLWRQTKEGGPYELVNQVQYRTCSS